MDADFFERAAKFFPKLEDYPPPERQRTVSIEEMLGPRYKKPPQPPVPETKKPPQPK